jgi:cytochrome c-type biogenesis protein CcmH/NrfG
MRRIILASALLFACDVDFSKPKDPDPGLAQRIAQKKNDLLRNPDDVATLLELGELQVEAGQMFEAADNLIAARNKGSNDIRVNAGLTAAYFELGYMKAGIEELRGCIEKDRNNPDCLFAYGRLIEADPSERAKQELLQVWTKLLEVAPNHRKANYVRSSIEQLHAQLSSAKPPEEAASRPAEAAAPPPPEEQEPADPPPAGAAAIPGHPGGEPQQDDEVGELNPFGQAIARAIEAVKKNDAVAAEAAFRDALKIAPEDPGAMAGLAETLFAQNKQEDAVKTIEKAYALDSKDPQVRWAFGLIMMRNQKRMTDAVAAWEALNADDPDYAQRLGIPQRLEQIKKYMQPGAHPPTTPPAKQK